MIYCHIFMAKCVINLFGQINHMKNPTILHIKFRKCEATDLRAILPFPFPFVILKTRSRDFKRPARRNRRNMYRSQNFRNLVCIWVWNYIIFEGFWPKNFWSWVNPWAVAAKSSFLGRKGTLSKKSSNRPAEAIFWSTWL